MSGSAEPTAQIAWEPSLPPLLLAIAGAAAAVVLFWSYLRLKGHPVTATGYLLLRLFGTALVIAALAGPTGVLPASKRRSREVLVLVDASLSMKNDHRRISDRLHCCSLVIPERSLAGVR